MSTFGDDSTFFILVITYKRFIYCTHIILETDSYRLLTIFLFNDINKFSNGASFKHLKKICDKNMPINHCHYTIFSNNENNILQ